MLAITTGAGLMRATGQYQKIEPATVDTLAQFLGGLPPIDEGWWSGHVWRDNKRGIQHWLASSVLVCDIDFETAEAPFPDQAQALSELATSGKIPGSFFHLTPHGARVAFVLAEPCSDKTQVLSAARAVDTVLAESVAGSGYQIDVACTKDLARLYFMPNAIAKGVQRQATVTVMRGEPYAVAELIALSEPAVPETAPTPVRRVRTIHAATFDGAAEQWVYDHAREYPRSAGECPVCSHKGCFGQLPDSPGRWYCFSTDHPATVGVHGANGYHGDALDLEAYARGCKPVDVLRRDGYLGTPRPAATQPRASGGAQAADSEPAPAYEADPVGAFRPWRSRSYLTAVDIIEKNARDVLEGRALELNEMTGRIELGRMQIVDSHVSRIRRLIEARFVGGVDKNNNEIGLQVSVSDIFSAVEEVAASRNYHPVREYLTRLKWDGVPRIDSVVDDILGAERSELNIAMVRKFMISAVARAMKPGCKVDTMLVLVGRQGAMKSTLFRTLAGAWFCETAVDIHHKDSFQVLRTTWIYEWAELEMLRRARDASAAKAFLSAQIDTYRPSHARIVVDVPRGCVIVGTSNPEEFLTDDTGNRRFWPLRVGEINMTLVREQRDQLWAESVSAYNAGEGWWFSEELEIKLAGRHEEHSIADPWDSAIWLWAAKQVTPFTCADVLQHPLEKPRGHWEDRDMKRVVRSLKRGGFKYDTNKPHRGSRLWTAAVTESTPAEPGDKK